MISKIVSVAALAGLATASCPLSVELTGSSGHVANVAVTNTGKEPVTVFKGNTIFSDHATKDLRGSDHDGKSLKFHGVYQNFKPTGLSKSLFQTIQPGEKVVTQVNAGKTFDLVNVPKATVNVDQNILYTTGSEAPSSLKGMQLCQLQSDSLDITPDQKTAASDRHSKRTTPFNSRIQRRDVSYNSSCSGDRVSTLQSCTDNAISMSQAASTAAGSAGANYDVWFKDTSLESQVQDIYNKVAGIQTTGPNISCTDDYSDCSDGVIAYTLTQDNNIVICPDGGFWTFPLLADTCEQDDLDQAGSVLHEMSHLFGTGDFAYGADAAKQLPADQATNNADTFEMYAGSVRLGGCT